MNNKQRKKRGRPPKHGGYSLLIKSELPENRKHIREYLTGVRGGLIQDLGPTEKGLTTAQIVLIDRVVTKLGVIRCMEEHVRENTVMKGDRLSPCLRASYLAYNNSIRLDLQALGIEKKQADKVLDLGAYLEKKTKEKEEKQK